jgi:hypothetical protein
MRILIDLVSRTLRPSRALAPMIRHLCTALVAANRIILKKASLPSLYLSGVRYRHEPSDWTEEHFDNAETCFARGWGDCDDLASWRVAELLNQGVPAAIVVMWKPVSGGRLFHIKVRIINPHCTAKHDVSLKGCVCKQEDPSARLGMRTGS